MNAYGDHPTEPAEYVARKPMHVYMNLYQANILVICIIIININ